ncbi:MAG: SCO family protein [Rhodothermales bacterium]|nr:SCO family protein [Rhodothermales bacterium]
MPFRRVQTLLTALLLLAGGPLVRPAAAQLAGQDTPAELEGVGIDERLGETVPHGLVFRDADGEAVRLGDYFDGERPVLLNLVYHDCPMLCNLILDKLTATLRAMDWVPGGEFEVLTVSFNAIETPALAARQKARYVADLGVPEAAAGWHFLTGDTTAVDALTDAVGFRYRWVERQQEFAHPAALIFLGGDGRIMRYLYGFDFPPADVRRALVEASEGRVGTTLDQVLLFCFQYDPQANSYVPHAINLMKVGGLLTLLALLATLAVFWRRERGDARAASPARWAATLHET